MQTFVAALFMGFSPVVAADTSPDLAMLVAFQEACARVDDLDHMLADARRSGWEAIADDGDPRIGRVTRAGRAGVNANVRASGQTFRRHLRARDLFLVASRVVMDDGSWGNGCRLFHFEATDRINRTTLELWMRRPPTGVQDIPGNALKLLWEPGWREGVTIEINHIPPRSKLRSRLGLSGNILVAQAIGGF